MLYDRTSEIWSIVGAQVESGAIATKDLEEGVRSRNGSVVEGRDELCER